MAVANTKSGPITNADATPIVLNNPRIAGAYLREAVGTVEVAAADDNNSVYRFVRVPSNARISTVQIASDAITSGSDFNIGIWQTAQNGGAVLSENLFGDAVDLSSGIAYTDVTLETTATDIANAEKELWQLLGLSTDPHVDYDICAIGIAVGSAAGTISLRVRYTA